MNEITPWTVVAVLVVITGLLFLAVEYWRRSYEEVKLELDSLKDKMGRRATEQASMGVMVSPAEYKKQQGDKSRKNRPGYETNCVCPKCGCLMFGYVGGDASSAGALTRRKRLFCRSCPHEEEL